MLATVRVVLITVLLAQAAAAQDDDADAVLRQTGVRPQDHAQRLQPEPTRTGKERLGRKSTDEQRVDNCNVPPELRGPKPRPDDCTGNASGGPKH
jgi:hypothetical protein